MPNLNSRVKSIRISNECADYFEDKRLSKVVESAYRLLKSGVLYLEDDELKCGDIPESLLLKMCMKGWDMKRLYEVMEKEI